MFGPERFASIESPNVIDPGDAPPVQPKRKQQQQQTAGETSSSTLPPARSYRATGLGRTEKISLGNDDDDRVPSSPSPSSRLVNRVEDLDVEQQQQEPTRPFKSWDDDDGVEEGNHHSLPSIDEARHYAASLLMHADRRGSSWTRDLATEEPSNVPTSSSHPPLREYSTSSSSSSKHLVCRQILLRAAKVGGLVLVLVLVVLALSRMIS